MNNAIEMICDGDFCTRYHVREYFTLDDMDKLLLLQGQEEILEIKKPPIESGKKIFVNLIVAY